MTKKEMALWYAAVCKASQECYYGDSPGKDDGEKLENWDSFFMEWARLLFVEAGCPKGWPWRVDA